MNDASAPRVVFETGRADLIAIAKSVLVSANVEYGTRGEGVQELFGWGRFPFGANVAMVFAGARPARVARVAALDGFGVPEETPDRAPTKLSRWLDALAHPPGFAGYRNLEAVADRLCKNNPRLARDRALFIAAHWARVAPDGTATLRADPKHKLPFPITTRMEDMYALWRAIEAPTLWVAGAQSHIAGWLAGERDPSLEVARRFAHLRHGRLETVADAGHMLHHDQPVALARLLDSFFAA